MQTLAKVANQRQEQLGMGCKGGWDEARPRKGRPIVGSEVGGLLSTASAIVGDRLAEMVQKTPREPGWGLSCGI